MSTEASISFGTVLQTREGVLFIPEVMVVDIGSGGSFNAVPYFEGGDDQGNMTGWMPGTARDTDVERVITQINPRTALGYVIQAWASNVGSEMPENSRKVFEDAIRRGSRRLNAK